ncbi:MAG: bifunctional demethylmenaquinone methyltransferase/2-methoxy-6-polyprenyl-1,4-benzoquinol methylase UbiE [Candidatus Xenobia bacterium]
MPRGEDVQRMFARITPRYDLLNCLLSLGLDNSWRRRVVAEAAPGRNEAALDLCTGTGALAALLAQRAGRVVGLDFCEPMLVDARRKYPGIEFVQGDAHTLPYPDGAFQVITIAFGLRNLERPTEALREWYRVLSPGGRLVVLELTRPERGVMCHLYAPYLRIAVPLVGGLVSGDFAAYRYLSTSIQGFMTVAQCLGMIQDAGFVRPRQVSFMGGVCNIMLGERE